MADRPKTPTGHAQNIGDKGTCYQTAGREPSPTPQPTRLDLLHCGPCLEERKPMYSVAYCNDCQTYICTGCLDIHRKLPTTRSHVIIPSGSCTEQPSDQYLAQTHQQILQDLMDLKCKFQQIRTAKQRNIADINKQSHNAVKQVRLIRRNVDKLLDKLENDTVTEIRNSGQTKIASINRRISEADVSIHDIQSEISALNTAAEKETGHFQMCQKALIFVNEYRAKQKDLTHIQMVSLSFARYTRLEELLSSMRRLGEVKLDIAYSMESIKAEKVDTFDTRVGEENATKGYWITGIALLPSGCVLVADKRNSKIKLFSRSYIYVDSLPLDDNPCDIAAVSDHEAVVTLPYRRYILFIQLMDGNIQCDVQTRMIRTRGQCYGIAYCDEHLIVGIRDANTSRVDVMDVTGIVTSTIVQDAAGNNLLKEPQYIAVDHWTKTIYISDQGKNCLVIATMAGRHVTSIDVGPHFPLGIDVDSNGNVYFCYSNGQVRVMSKDGSDQRPLLLKEKGFRNPQAICYHAARHCLLLSLAGDTRLYLYNLTSQTETNKWSPG